MVKIQDLCQSYTSMTEDKWTTWQREWAVMAVNYVQSHWSYWLISQNLRTFSCLQCTWLGQLAVSLSPAEPRICRFCMCGSLNSACIWLIDEICRQVVFCNLPSGMRSTKAPNSPKTKMINGVLLIVFPRPAAQTLGTWLTASEYHWLTATGSLGLSTHGSIIKIQDKN